MVLKALLTGCALLAIGCAGRPANEPVLRVAVASSLRFAMEALESSFEKALPEIEIEATYGASGAFFAQLENGAPFDVFLSADVEYPTALADRGLTASGSFLYATGRLVAWSPGDGMDGWQDPSIRKIAIANPRLAPYGRAAEEALQFLAVPTKGKLVLGDSVAQALHFAQSGAADVALVAESLLHAPQLADAGRSWPIPPKAYRPIAHAGVILSSSGKPAAAEAFRDFLLSPEGQTVLARLGFGPPES